jgi:eukaryotic-like serine/threonine-protein kinase
LIEALWDDAPPGTAHKAVQVYVSQLRKALGHERIATRPPGYELRVDPDEVDVNEFERFLAAGRARDALHVWRGAPLADFTYESFAQPHIARLEELRLACLEQRIDGDLAAGKHSAVVGELEGFVREHPLRERLVAQLMLALYRSGRQAEALDVYTAARSRLAEELGLDPSAQLKDLHHAILRQDPALDATAAMVAEPQAETPSPTFVGRETELAELVAGLDDAFAARGRLFLLAGEPGIGKTRLAEELAALARSRGAAVLVGRCWEAGGAPAYWPWVQSLRGYVRETPDDVLRAQLASGAADIAQIVPELRDRFPDLPALPPLEAEGARFRLFDATAEFLRNAAGARPIVLVLDDLHAADAPSLLLLQFLARDLATARLLVLGAYRDVDPVPQGALTETLAVVAREPGTRRLALRGLSEQDIEEYVYLAASELSSATLASDLYEATEGNALFVAEIVRLLAVEGAAPRPDGAHVAIPQSVRDVIALRLAHLAAECKPVLELASVVGREFGLDVLARLSACPEDELLDAFDEAIGARVVSNVPGAHDRLRFAHVLIRDTLYDELSSARRVRIHRQVVQALEEIHGDTSGPHLAELAHHAIAGNDVQKGIRYAQSAGDRALELLAYEEAARQYAAALDALDKSSTREDQLRCELLLGIGEARVRGGDTAAAKEAFLEAADLARRLDLPHLFASAAAGYAREDMYLRRGADARLVTLIEEALGVLGEADVELRARLLGRLAGALRDELSRTRRDDVSRTALELARRSGNRAALAFALDGRVAAMVGPDTVEECLALATELRDVAESIGDLPRIIHGNLHRLIAQLTLGDLTELEVGLARISDLAEQRREPSQQWDVVAARAAFALVDGRLPEAAELIEQAFELGERTKPEAAIPVYRLQRYMLHDFRNEPAEVERELNELVATFPSRVAFRCALIHLDARAGHIAQAQEALHELSPNRFAAVPFDQEWLFGMSFLAETTALIGDADSASVLYELLLPYHALNAADWPEGIRGAVSRYLGLLAATMSRWDDGADHYEHALELNSTMGMKLWVSHTQLDYARLLSERCASGDRARAESLLAHAIASYRSAGMDSYAASASSAATMR